MLENRKNEKTVLVSVASERAEALGGVLIAVFAALMAISQMVNGELEEEMMIAHNNVVNYSNWYQSKSIKQTLKESEKDYLKALISSGIVNETKTTVINSKIKEVEKDILKYQKEKTEILLGSSKVGKDNWRQDKDGVLGNITGVKEWEELANKYDIATKKFDYSLLFFNISIVLGAVCVIIYDNPSLQKKFIILLIISGVIGAILSIYGYMIAP